MFIFVEQKQTKMKQITPEILRRKLETAQAKEWGYRTPKQAQADGYSVTRNNCTIKEMAEALKLNDNAARGLVQDWKSEGLINYTSFCGLDQIIFI